MFGHILVPLDGSQLSEKALPVAAEMASRFESRVSLLNITRPPFVAVEFGGESYAEMLSDLRQQGVHDAESYLADARKRLLPEGVAVNLIVMDADSPAGGILYAVEQQEIDLIVMSTHGRGGVSRWVFGSVADKVLQHADVPVLIVRPEGVNPGAEA